MAGAEEDGDFGYKLKFRSGCIKTSKTSEMDENRRAFVISIIGEKYPECSVSEFKTKRPGNGGVDIGFEVVLKSEIDPEVRAILGNYGVEISEIRGKDMGNYNKSCVI